MSIFTQTFNTKTFAPPPPDNAYLKLNDSRLGVNEWGVYLHEDADVPAVWNGYAIYDGYVTTQQGWVYFRGYAPDNILVALTINGDSELGLMHGHGSMTARVTTGMPIKLVAWDNLGQTALSQVITYVFSFYPCIRQ